MSDSKRRNYHKESRYAAQAKYQKAHYQQLSLKLPNAKKAELDAIANARGVSVAALVKQAIKDQYGIDCFTQK